MSPQKTIDFRPHQGLMKLGERLCHNAGLSVFWGGEQGIGSVLAEVLDSAGIPREPIALTPRAAAQAAGLVKKPRKRRAR